jgi:branched-chain amino acid transport system substrate-binding protein
MRATTFRQWWKFLFAAFLGIALLSIPGCKGGGGATDADAIKIGVVLPITGREAKPGQYQREGIQVAIKKINDAGGVFVKQLNKKLPLREVFYDDGSDQARSPSLVERTMTTDNVVAVLGGYSTALGEAESVMPDRYKTPWITTGAAATTIFSHNYQWVFGTLSPTTLLGSTTAEFLGSLVDQGKLKKGLKIAMAIENTDHGIDYGNGIKQWIKDHPGYFDVALSESFSLGGTDFSALLQKVKSSNADIFLADAHLADYIAMHRQYVQSGMYHEMISYGARGPEKDAKDALGDSVLYIFAGIWWSKNLPYPQIKEFVNDYKTMFGREPDSWYPATAYDAVRVLSAAIEQAGSLDKTAIRDALRKTDLKDSLLPGQELKFESNGQVNLRFVIVQNQSDGKAPIVYPKDIATGEAIAPTPKKP